MNANKPTSQERGQSRLAEIRDIFSIIGFVIIVLVVTFRLLQTSWQNIIADPRGALLVSVSALIGSFACEILKGFAFVGKYFTRKSKTA